MVFKATFNNISLISRRSENHRHLWVGFELTTLVVIGTDCIGSHKPYDHDYNAPESILNIRYIFYVINDSIVLGYTLLILRPLDQALSWQ